MNASTVEQADQYRRGVGPAVFPTDIQNGVDGWPFSNLVQLQQDFVCVKSGGQALLQPFP